MPNTGPRSGRELLHVAAGCIGNARGEVLICQRPARKIYPGEWEFPGGKVEPGETAEQALRRELREELSIEVTACEPLTRLQYVYPELSVDLDVWRVTAYRGEVKSAEHPEIAWVQPSEMGAWKLLAANRPIVTALRLPEHCIFTPADLAPDELVRRLTRIPPALLRLRLPGLDDQSYEDLVRDLAPVIGEYGHELIVDRDAALVDNFGADGFHATSAVLREMERRPVGQDRWFGASCHSAAELEAARRVGADYAVLGPVRATRSHEGRAGLGWDQFRELAATACLPVYAIGGLGPADLRTAREHGAVGVAGISAFWARY